LREQGSWFRVPGSAFRVQGSGFRVQGSGFRVQGSGLGERVLFGVTNWGSKTVQGLGRAVAMRAGSVRVRATAAAGKRAATISTTSVDVDL
jgi:hypothetical protein